VLNATGAKKKLSWWFLN